LFAVTDERPKKLIANGIGNARTIIRNPDLNTIVFFMQIDLDLAGLTRCEFARIQK
jgi:hypothetical protein